MSQTPLILKITSQFTVQETIDAQSKALANSGPWWSGYTDNQSCNEQANGNIFVAKSGGTTTIPLPASVSLGKFFAWQTSSVVDIDLTGIGGIVNSDYGIMKGEFTGIQITNNGEEDVTGHYMILGS